MDTAIYKAIALFAAAILIAAILFRCLLKWSVRFGFTDKPDERKLHRRPIPVIGGLGILGTVIISMIISPWFRSFATDFPEILFSSLIVSVTGIVDDRINLEARKRLLVELICSFIIARSGIRIYSLHGFMGIEAIPEFMQYVLTIIIISGITNAFNLLDGIDGLAGTMALINCFVLGLVAFFLGQYNWTFLMATVCGSLLVFLRYNWYPAKMFMGDGGSLLLGLLMSVAAIQLLHAGSSGQVRWLSQPTLAVLFSACFIIPVMDTIRVFIERINAGFSPFRADRTHLHHKLLGHFLLHKDASRKIALLHVFLILISLILQPVFSLSFLIISQIVYIIIYVKILDFAQNYSRWYRQVKRMEARK